MGIRKISRDGIGLRVEMLQQNALRITITLDRNDPMTGYCSIPRIPDNPNSMFV